MNFKKASELLDLSQPFSLHDLKKNYRTKALITHPDKNPDCPDANKKFQEVNEAYQYLILYLEVKNEDINTDYQSLLDKFLQSLQTKDLDKQLIRNLLNNIGKDCQNLSLKIFQNMEKGKAVDIYQIVVKYQKILHISDETTDKMAEIIREKIKDDNIIILNPTLGDLFKNNIYKLEFQGEIFYIPLWHSELHYEISKTNLIVKCIPDIPKHVSIDQYNNVHISLTLPSVGIFCREKIEFKLGETEFSIPMEKLFIKKYQTYCLKRKGISLIYEDDVYNIEQKGHIYAHIDIV